MISYYSSWWLWRVWNLYLYYFLKLYCFSVFVCSHVLVLFSCIYTIPCIDTIFLYLYRSSYRYHFSILWYSIVICTVLIAWRVITCYVDHLTLDMQLLDTCPLLWYHLSLFTCHINTWHVIITFSGILYLLSYIIYSDLYPSYSCTLILLNSWTCSAPAIPVNW